MSQKTGNHTNLRIMQLHGEHGKPDSPKLFDVVEITQEDLVVDCSTKPFGPKEMHTVQVSYVHTTGVGRMTF